MKHSLWLVPAVAAGLLFASCAKETPENTWPESTASNGALQNFLLQHAPPIQQFTFNAASGGFFVGQGGATLLISPNAFVYQNNMPVSGMVTVKLQEVYSKRDMVLTSASTTSNGLPLISGGEINVTAWQGANELRLVNNNSVFVTIPAGNSTPPAMMEFGARALDATTDFAPLNQTVQVAPDSAGSWIYTFALDSLDWTNCDVYMGYPNPTMFSATVPDIFFGDNCMVFVTSDLSNYAARIWEYDSASHTFLSGYYRLPVGQDFTFTAIGEINGNFYYASQTVTITENIAVSLVPQVISEAQMLQNIGNL
jgi:hypothetical protein